MVIKCLEILPPSMICSAKRVDIVLVNQQLNCSQLTLIVCRTVFPCIKQVPSALAFQSATHNIISFTILTNMSISNNNKSLDKCILNVMHP